MTLLYFLPLFPLVPALGMLLARGDRARDAVGLIGSGIIMAVTVVVAVMFFGTGPQGFEVAPGTSHAVSYTHLDVYKRQDRDGVQIVDLARWLCGEA